MCAPGFKRTMRQRRWMDFCAPQPAASVSASSIDPAATVAIFHTSGTSGFPKGAALSSNALLGARASTVLAGLFLGPKDLALIALPWSHIMAVSIALYGLMAGIRGCFLDRFDVAARAGPGRALRCHRLRRRARHVRPAGQQQSRTPPGSRACACGSPPATICPPKSVNACGSSARWSGCPAAGAFRRYC